MRIKLSLLPILLLAASYISGQQAVTFGELGSTDRLISATENDPEVPAIVLYEKGDNYFEVIKNYIMLVKKYHVRIKILNEKGFAEGTISIPYYHADGSGEKVEGLRAMTHNGEKKTYVLPQNIFTKDLSTNTSEKAFTFPDLKPGAILEYEYKITSPYIYNFNGWSFQSHLPKKYSEFNATIPGNYRYNRNLSGALKLDLNEAKLVRECFKIEGTLRAADCEVLKYVMKDIPAFKEESYMLATSNYISRIDFELSEHHRMDGITDRYTESWENVDDELRNNRDLGVQLNKKGYFERNVPESLLTEGDAMNRATKIHNFVRSHYTWTGEFSIYKNTRVKEAFEARRGNVGEINISLINLLNSAGIPTQMMLTSTRAHGLPKRNHPVMTDFNYVLARATIDGKVFYLDATDPLVPFGMLPFHCLNYYGRVMDFKNGSYWEDIVISEPNRHMIRAQLAFSPGLGESKGVLDEITIGYEALYRREALRTEAQQAYLDKRELEMGSLTEITNYSRNSDPGEEKRVSERFEFSMPPQPVNGKLYFNPFLILFFDQNPFTLANRQYPVDFGHTRNYAYSISLVVPEGYVAERLPAPRQKSLSEQIGVLKLDVNQAGNNITLLFNLALNRPQIAAEHYAALKAFFDDVVDIQKNSLIVLSEKAGTE